MTATLPRERIAPTDDDPEGSTSGSRLVDASIRHPRRVFGAVIAVVLLALVGFLRVEVDTDPENMLPVDDPVRVRNALLADEFGVGPMIVVGAFGDVTSADGFAAIDRLHTAIADSPDVDTTATFSAASAAESLPSDDAAAESLATSIADDPLLGGNVLFDRTADGGPEGAAIFVTLTDKSAASDVADLARYTADDDPVLADVDIVIAGQPLAEDAFGQEMFVQMAIFAPLAGLFVFAVLWLFFRRLRLVLPAMVVAVATVVITMGALVGTGNTLHIMSSMIPIFLMPIAILDAVHVLSEFFDRHDSRDREAVLHATLAELRRPIGYTTLTTAVGFASLMLVPIPPVRVFGAFVAFGVGIAWLLTMTLLPALLIVADGGRLRPNDDGRDETAERSTWLHRLGETVVRRRRGVLVGVVALAVVAIPGVVSLTVNDNPVRWFRADHTVRESTEQLGAALPGTFTANLLLTETTDGSLEDPDNRRTLDELVDVLTAHPDVGAVQSPLDSDLPLFRSEDRANVRLQLTDGDNVAMASVVAVGDRFLESREFSGLEVEWAGEAFLNLTWQEKMVSGMLVGFATTLVAIFALLVALFRSLRWAVLAMIPVLWTVLLVYGAIGLAGRDIDMPIAVLSTMVLGIGVDFAIHFVERFRRLRTRTGSAAQATTEFFGEPARAMTRNAVVIAVGFSPLLLSSLVPYVVVGALLASIVVLSWLATLVVLPAAVQGVQVRVPTK